MEKGTKRFRIRNVNGEIIEIEKNPIPAGCQIFYIRDKNKCPIFVEAFSYSESTEGKFRVNRATLFCNPVDYPPNKDYAVHRVVGRYQKIMSRQINHRSYLPTMKSLEYYKYQDDKDPVLIATLSDNNGINKPPLEIEKALILKIKEIRNDHRRL